MPHYMGIISSYRAYAFLFAVVTVITVLKYITLLANYWFVYLRLKLTVSKCLMFVIYDHLLN